MEDSSEMRSEENRVSLEKSTKRILKTPTQVMALEKFYSEHNYPTEEMKSELAEEIGLTEKQISSWFCHRRLKDKRLSKDETCANGRQDRSSAIMQDRGSGLRQDSCGSTKQSDYKIVDPKEVESQRLYSQNFSVADLTYDRTSQHTGDPNEMDDTSSENRSSLQDNLFSQREDLYDLKTSQNGAARPLIPKGASNMAYKPAGYLKVKGEIENAAITAVKRQLGKHYREDGPLLGVEFQPLPPGAFSSSSKDIVNGAFYVGELGRIHSTDVSGVHKPSGLSNRYAVYDSKISPQEFYMEGANFDLMNAFDSHEKIPHHRFKKKSTSHNHSNSNPGGKFSMDYYDDVAAETSTHSSKRNYKMSSKHGIEGLRVDIPNHHYLDGGKVTSELTDPWLQDHGSGSPKIVPRNDYMSKSSDLIPGSVKSLDTEERVLTKRAEKEARLYGEVKGMKRYQDPAKVKTNLTNEVKVPKRFRSEFPHPEYVTKPSFPNTLRKTNLNKGTVMERPSSFSEDETAETSSSME